MGNKSKKLMSITIGLMIILTTIALVLFFLEAFNGNNSSHDSMSIILHVNYNNGEDEGGNYSFLNISKIDTNKFILEYLTLNSISYNWVGYKEIYNENDYPPDNSNMIIIASGKFIDIIDANVNSPVIYYDRDGDRRLSINDSIRINLDYKSSNIKISAFDLFVDLSSDHVWIHILSNNQQLQLD